MEKDYLELLNVLCKKIDIAKAIEQIEILSYFAYKTVAFQINFSEVDFSNHIEFNNNIIEIASKCDEENSVLIKDIVCHGILIHCKELNDVFHHLLKYPKEKIVEMLFRLSLPMNKYAEQYTDSNLCDLVVELTKKVKKGKVLDLCSGKANFLSKISKENTGIELFGYEINHISSLISRLKLSLFTNRYSIKNENVLSISTIGEYDLVFSHYPWAMRSGEQISQDFDGKLDYSNINRNRVDWAFVIKALNSINTKGKAYVVVPVGILFSSTDIKNRKNMVEGGYLESIINLPGGTLNNTTIEYCILVLSNNNSKIKMVDARNCFKKYQRSKDIDVDEIVNLVNMKDESNLVRMVTFEEIKATGYDLSINQYVEKVPSLELVNAHKLSQIAEVITGFQYTSKSIEELEPNKGNVSIIKINNIHMGKFNYEDLMTAEIEIDKIKKYILQKNDILITNKGAKPKVVLIKDMKSKIVVPHSNLSIIRLSSNKVLPLYLYAFLSGDTGTNLLKSLMKGSKVISNISKKDLMDMKIPVLDMKDQQLIVGRYKVMSEKLELLNKEIDSIKVKMSTIYADTVGD